MSDFFYLNELWNDFMSSHAGIFRWIGSKNYIFWIVMPNGQAFSCILLYQSVLKHL